MAARARLRRTSGHSTGTPALGGLVPAVAAGGVLTSYFTDTGALRSALSSDEKNEFAYLFGLSNSYANVGPKKYYTPPVKHDLGVLWNSHLPQLHALTCRAARDWPRLISRPWARRRLSRSWRRVLRWPGGPGGHPLWDANLRATLAAIMTIAGPTGGGAYLPVMSAETHSFGGDIIIDSIGRIIR